MSDHFLSERSNGPQRPVELAIAWQLEIAPVRQNRVHPVVKLRKDDADVSLYDVAIRPECIDILPKHQRCRSVDSKACEILKDIGIGAGIGALLPALAQPVCYALQCGEEALELMWGKRPCDDIALPAPFLSLD